MTLSSPADLYDLFIKTIIGISSILAGMYLKNVDETIKANQVISARHTAEIQVLQQITTQTAQWQSRIDDKLDRILENRRKP
jgi:hypothetical protein